jgi:H/ACA ribonucleoprotein complex subunit 2
MAKEKSEKRDKKEKKEKRSEGDGVKKSKKEKKSKLNGDNVAAAFEEVTKAADKPIVETKALVVTESSEEVVLKPVGALVPFANPLADEKVTKKVLKSVKKGAICYSVLPQSATITRKRN